MVRRRILTTLAVISLLLCVVAATLRFRTATQTDVFMVPTGRRSAILMSAHCGFGRPGWGEFTLLHQWPDPRFGWWSGPDWQNVGPLLIEAHLPGWRGYSGVWSRAGTFMVPKDGPSGPVAYVGSYRRAIALGFPNTLAPPPDSAIVTARQVRFPILPITIVTAILPLLVAVRFAIDLYRRCKRRSG